ncbi:unnamed protein product, partial [Laminaria digitata]
EGRTKLTVVAPDQAGLLALIAGTLAAHQLQILTAQVYAHVDSAESTPVRGRIAVDVLYVTDAHGELCDDSMRWSQVRADLRDAVKDPEALERLLSRRRAHSGLEPRHRPAVKNRVELAGQDSNRETVIDVFCEDRMGTLHTIAKTLTEQGL